MQLKLFIFLILVCNVAFAIPSKLCVPVDFKTDHKNITLSVNDKNTNQIYFFHNETDQSIWLDHPNEKKGLSAGWSSFLRPGKWSALLLNRRNFIITCASIDPGEVNYKDCAKYIKVCTVPKLTFESKRKGTYWLAEDKDWDTLQSNLEKRGAVIKN